MCRARAKEKIDSDISPGLRCNRQSLAEGIGCWCIDVFFIFGHIGVQQVAFVSIFTTSARGIAAHNRPSENCFCTVSIGR